jgi:hypothetical protein
MAAWQVGLVVLGVAAVAAVLVLSVSGMRAAAAQGGELDRTLVERYCRLVAEERYAEAWQECLTDAYRGNLPVEDFAAAHRKRRAEDGVIAGRELLHVQSSRNLFSRERRLQLLYRLVSASGERTRVLIVSDADGGMRVDGTYTESPSETLTFEVW